MSITLNALQQQRRDTASNWTSNNPTLLAGEWGIETDTKRFKIGDGTTAWQSLDYLPIPDANRLLTGSLTVGGNFTVNGNTTIIDSQTLQVEDANIVIGKVSTPTDTTADGGGITLKGATDKTFNWIDATDSWTSSENIDLVSGKVLKVNGTQVLSGTQYTGNSATSTTATNITVADESSDTSCNVLFTTGATGNLPPKTGTNLTFDSSTGALTATSFVGDVTGEVTGNITGNVTGNTSGSSGSCTGNSATATSLQTARDINGVSFDGTANITVADSTKLPLAGGTLTGDLLLDNQKDLRFLEADANGSNYVGFQAPANVASNVLWTLPATDASVSGFALISDASGNLSWGQAGGGAKGGGGEQIFHESANTMNNDYTISSNHNAVVPSPLTINATLTVNSPSVVTFV